MSEPIHVDSTAPVGFFARLLGMLADSVLEFVYIAVLLALARAAPDATGASPNPPVHFVVSYLLPFIVTLLLWSRWQSTPGKMMIRARIVDARTGGVPTMGQYIIRYLGYFVALLPLGLGFLWIVWDRRKQGWHDKLARTLVVRTVSATPSAAARGAELAATPAFTPVPAMAVVRSVSSGPWMNPGAAAGHASLVWIRNGCLHLAQIAAPDLPGAANAVAAHHQVPALAVPLNALHGATGDKDSGELRVRYGDEAGQLQEGVASLATPAHRDELLHSLQARLGHGWACVVEQGSRWKGVGDILTLTVIVALGTLGLQLVADQMASGTVPEINADNGKEAVALVVVYALARILGSEVIGVIGGILLTLCVLALPFVLFSPPRHVILRRMGSPATVAADLASLAAR